MNHKENPPTILVVDDEPAILSVLDESLAALGFRVLCAADGLEALRMAQSTTDPIHLLLSDVVMPEMTGHELAARLRRLFPYLRVIYMSAYMRPAIDELDLQHHRIAFLQKPFTTRKLTLTIKQVLGNRRQAIAVH